VTLRVLWCICIVDLHIMALVERYGLGVLDTLGGSWSRLDHRAPCGDCLVAPIKFIVRGIKNT
jgi:hypothetical protein